MDLSNIQTIKSLLQKHNLWAKKFLGQNFLIDPEALEKIVDTAEISNKDYVVEIGPGLGVLTNELSKLAKQVTTIELDKDMITILEQILKIADSKNVKILNEDALKFSPPKTQYKVVANIPYNITSPILNHFLQAENKPETMTLLVQKEVAEKICKKEPDMSVLSLQVALFGEAKMVKKIQAESFYPIPKVDSAILYIKIYKKSDPEFIPAQAAQKILSLAKRAFTQGRKKLSNTLPELKEKLKNLNIADKRPQHLSIKDWSKIL